MSRTAIEKAIKNHDEHAILDQASKAIEATGRKIHATVGDTLAKTRAAAGHATAAKINAGTHIAKKKVRAAADKSDGTNTGKALAAIARLPRLSDNDPDFVAIPIPQGRDMDVQALEKQVMGEHVIVDYDPSVTNPLATQDYLVAPKMIDLVKQGTAGEMNELPEHEPVRVARFRGRDYIVDGHHRLTTALLLGKKVKTKYYRVK